MPKTLYASLSLGQAIQELQRLSALYGSETPVFLACWDGQHAQYHPLTHIDPPEMTGDGITLQGHD